MTYDQVLDCLIIENNFSTCDNSFNKKKLKFLVDKLGGQLQCSCILKEAGFSTKAIEAFQLAHMEQYANYVYPMITQQVSDLYTQKIMKDILKRIQKGLELEYLKQFGETKEYKILFIYNRNLSGSNGLDKEIAIAIAVKKAAIEKNKEFNNTMRNFMYEIQECIVNGKVSFTAVYYVCKNYVYNHKGESNDAIYNIERFKDRILSLYENERYSKKSKTKKFINFMNNSRSKYLYLRNIIDIDEFTKECRESHYKDLVKINKIYGYNRYK